MVVCNMIGNCLKLIYVTLVFILVVNFLMNSCVMNFYVMTAKGALFLIPKKR